MSLLVFCLWMLTRHPQVYMWMCTGLYLKMTEAEEYSEPVLISVEYCTSHGVLHDQRSKLNGEKSVSLCGGYEYPPRALSLWACCIVISPWKVLWQSKPCALYHAHSTRDTKKSWVYHKIFLIWLPDRMFVAVSVISRPCSPTQLMIKVIPCCSVPLSHFLLEFFSFSNLQWVRVSRKAINSPGLVVLVVLPPLCTRTGSISCWWVFQGQRKGRTQKVRKASQQSYKLEIRIWSRLISMWSYFWCILKMPQAKTW